MPTFIIEGEVRQRDGKLRIEEHHVTVPALNADGEVDGYPGFKIIGQSARRPKDHQEWDREAGKWTVCPVKRAARERHALARDPDQMLDRYLALEARVAELEKKLAERPAKA